MKRVKTDTTLNYLSTPIPFPSFLANILSLPLTISFLVFEHLLTLWLSSHVPLNRVFSGSDQTRRQKACRLICALYNHKCATTKLIVYIFKNGMMTAREPAVAGTTKRAVDAFLLRQTVARCGRSVPAGIEVDLWQTNVCFLREM